MNNILVQIHDIKDPISYTVELLKSIQDILGKINVLFVIPQLNKNFFQDIDIPFEYRVIIGNEFLVNYNLDITDVDIDSCQLQQLVFERLGKQVFLEAIINKFKSYNHLYQKIYAMFKPDLCLCWNGQVHIDQTTFRDFIKINKVPTLFLERGLIPSSIFYDLKGVNATSSIVDWEESDYVDFDERIFNLTQSYIAQKGVSVVKLNQSETEFYRNFVLFPLQRDSDSNLVINSPYFKNMYSILKELDDSKLMFEVHYRVHPEDPATHYTKHLRFKNPMLLNKSDVNLEQHIEKSSAVMTVNSTIGFSSLLKGKKVITLGNSIYSNKGFTLDYKDFGSLQKIIDYAIYSEMTRSEELLRDAFLAKAIKNHHLVFENCILKYLQIKRLDEQLTKILRK